MVEDHRDRMSVTAFHVSLQRLTGCRQRSEKVEAVPLVWHCEDQPPRGLQQCGAVGQEANHVRLVLDHVRGDDPVITTPMRQRGRDRSASRDVVDLLDVGVRVDLPQLRRGGVVEDLDIVAVTLASDGVVARTDPVAIGCLGGPLLSKSDAAATKAKRW